MEPVGRTDRSFLEAARRHLIASWRYKPATEDGKAVASSTADSDDPGTSASGRHLELNDLEWIFFGDSKIGFREIVDGKHDEIPEQAYYMMGTIEEVLENAEKIQTAA